MCFCGAVTHGSPEQVWYLINEGVISLFCRLLQVKDLSVAKYIWEEMRKMLRFGREVTNNS